MWFMYVVILILLLFWHWWKKFASAPCKNFPPGPMGLPIIGYLPIVIEENLLAALDKIHDKFGGVISVNMGPSKPVVVIGEYHSLKEAFKDDKGNGRHPDMMWFNETFRYGNGKDARGLLFSLGHEWTEQRRFALRRLRDFGLGKSSMEELIHDEIRQLFEQLDNQINQPLTMSLIYNLSVVNALWTLLTGSRLALDDPKLQDMVQKVDEMVKESSNVTILNVIPGLRHIIPEWSGWNKVKRTLFDMKGFINNVIDQHRLNYDEAIKENPRDFIDAFLNQIHDDANKGTSFYGNLGQQNLESVLLDLLFAGIETTSTALTWSTLFMIKYPHIQRKVQDEIFAQVGDTRLVTLDDKQNLPFTEAVIQEVLRITCIAPLGIPHCSTADITLESGHKIPKGTMIFPNLHRITRNSKVFDDPSSFKPERFIDRDGKYCKNEHNIPFSIGKRDCLGRSLALSQFFLFFASLMQRYSFKSIHENLDMVDTAPVVMFTQTPKPFKGILNKRS